MGQQFIKSFDQTRVLTTLDFGMAGSMAGLSTLLLITPLERFKILLQTSNSSFYGLWKQHGLKNSMRGFRLTLLRDVVGNFIYFSMYEHILRNSFLSTTSKLNVLASGGFN